MQAYQTLFIVLAIAGAVAVAGDRLKRIWSTIIHSRLASKPSRNKQPAQTLMHKWALKFSGIALLAALLLTTGLGGQAALQAASGAPMVNTAPAAALSQPVTDLSPPVAVAIASATSSTEVSQLKQSAPRTRTRLTRASNSQFIENSHPLLAQNAETAEVVPVPQPSRWQRMQGFLFVFYILVLSGVIATVGDRLGYRIGKKRLSWFNLRPRHTAILVTILTGIFISASSVGVLLLTNQSIADALFNYTKRVTQLQTEIQTLEGDITSVQGQLTTLEAQRLEAENRVDQLTTEQAELRRLKEAVEEELATANQSLETTREQLSSAQNSLDVAQQETAQAEEAAEIAQARVNQLQASLLSTEEELTALQTQKVDLETDIENLVAVAERLRRGEFAVLAGEPLATGVIEGGMTPGDIQQALNSLFAIAERRARTLGATPSNSSGRAIQIRVPEVTRVIQEVSTPGSWVVQVFSLTNRLVGEPVPVITGVIPNRLLFSAGTVLSETSIAPGRSDEDIEETLVRLFLEAGQKSRNEGILFDTSTGTVGEFSQSRLFELVQRLRRIDEPVNVQVVAQRDIFTSGPLEVDLLSNGVALLPESGDPGNAAPFTDPGSNNAPTEESPGETLEAPETGDPETGDPETGDPSQTEGLEDTNGIESTPSGANISAQLVHPSITFTHIPFTSYQDVRRRPSFSLLPPNIAGTSQEHFGASREN